MDLNDIKNIWSSSFSEKEKFSRGEIEEMLTLKSRSNTAIEKIKRSFRLELILGSLMYLFIIIALICLMKMPELLVFLGLVTIIMGLPLYFYFKNYLKIKHVTYSLSTLKQTLVKTVDDIEEFVNIGKGTWLKFIMIPSATIIGMFIGLFIGTGESNIVDIFMSLQTRSIIKMILLLVIFSGIMIPLSKYYFKKKFKQHYIELKSCLKELDEDPVN
jgi:hypothetical protein